MAMRYLLPILALFIWAFSSRAERLPVVDEQTPVAEVLQALGEPVREDTRPKPLPGVSEELGRQIVLEGMLRGGNDQSAHFKCTSCHNTVREDPVLNDPDPEARLAYAEEQDLPFLPGTTLWGAVNRETYYNDDYVKKYGDLVGAARHDLRGAIQLCATECAQGKPLSEVEMESVLTYLHGLGLRLADLPNTTPAPTRSGQINKILSGKEDAGGIINELKSSYNLGSPASFVVPPEDRRAGYAATDTPDPGRGQSIYDRSCMHCHGGQRYSFFLMEREAEHYRYLAKHFPRYTRFSSYQTIRYGTSPIPGKRAYMPHYTKERMSDLQVEDLRAFLEAAAAK